MVKKVLSSERVIIISFFPLFVVFYFVLQYFYDSYVTSFYIILSSAVGTLLFINYSKKTKNVNKKVLAGYLKKILLDNYNLINDNYLILENFNENIKNSRDIINNVHIKFIKKNNDNLEILTNQLKLNELKDYSLDDFVKTTKYSSFAEFDEKDIIDIKNAKKLYEGNRLIFTYNLFTELAQNFLNSIVRNVNKAADPLSEEVYQIKQNVSNFLEDITNWKDELNDENSDKNFNNVVELYNLQSNGFSILTSKISDNYSALENDLEGINQQFKEIDKTTKNIKDIASNVNILALNASVEAIRAGRYGAGFRVIADETKRLSDDTQKLLENISGVVNETKLIILRLTDRVKTDLHGMIEKIDFQKNSCTSFHGILENYYKNFNKIFSSVSDETSMIYEHIDKISPTFQLHDVIVQELSNLSAIMSKIVQENISLIDSISADIENISKEEIINNLVSEIEKKITTDGEVDVLGSMVEKYDLKRAIEVKKVETDIEFF